MHEVHLDRSFYVHIWRQCVRSCVLCVSVATRLQYLHWRRLDQRRKDNKDSIMYKTTLTQNENLTLL